MIALSKLPQWTPFVPQQMYGVALSLVAADAQLQIEVQRAPDVSGSPGAYTSLGNFGPYPRGQGVFVDWWASDLTISGFWYQARHVGPHVDPGPFTAAIGPIVPYLVRRSLYDSGLQEPVGIDGLTDGVVHKKTVNMAGGDNLAENGNFEAATVLLPNIPVDHPSWLPVFTPPGWDQYNFNDSVFSYETATQYSGAQSLKMVTAHNGGGLLMTKRFKASAGEYWSVQGAMKVGSGTARISLAPRNGAGSALSEIAVDCSETSWTPYATSGQLPAGTVQVTVHIYMPVSGTGYFDDIVVMRNREAVELAPEIIAETLGVRPTTLACYTFGQTNVTAIDHAGGPDLVFDTSAGWLTGIGGNGAYLFANSDSRHANAAHPTQHDVGAGANFTIDCVFRYDGVSSSAVDTYLVVHENDYELAIDHNNQLWVANRNHWSGNFPGIDISKYLGRWIHLKWLYTSSSSTSQFYINGVLVATHVDTGAATGTATGDVLEVGHRVSAGSVLNGAIAYLRVSKGQIGDFPFLDVALALQASTAIDTNGIVQSGLLPSVGIQEGTSTSKIYRHREDVTVAGPDTDGIVPNVNFGNTYQNAPQITFRGGQLVSFSNTLPAGKQRLRLQASNVVAAHFDSISQIAVVGVTTTQNLDFASGNSKTLVGDTVSVTTATVAANDNNYTINFFASVTLNANSTNLCVATLVIAVDTNDGTTGFQERATYTYTASPNAGPPPYGAVTSTFSTESKTISVTGLVSGSTIRLRVKSFVVSNGGAGSFIMRGADGAGTNPETARGVVYTTATDTTESAIPSTGDQVLWSAQEVS